jgi:ferredoxin-NADP reductase
MADVKWFNPNPLSYKMNENKPEIIFYPVRLEKIIEEYKQVVTFRFASDTPLAFVPGQHAHLQAPNTVRSKATVRHLSIASTPKDGWLDFTMDLNSPSEFKQKFAAAKPGDMTSLFKIGGEFCINPDIQNKVAFIAGGIGITPIRSLLRQIDQELLQVAWELIHISRDKYLYEDEFNHYPGEQHRIRRLDCDRELAACVARNKDGWFYLSGSNGFVEGIRQKIVELQIDPARIVTEDFR